MGELDIDFSGLLIPSLTNLQGTELKDFIDSGAGNGCLRCIF